MSEKSPNIGRFEVAAELGRGSMGIVHRAHDPVMGRDVAIKRVLLPHGLSDSGREEYLQRFQREARAAGRLSHPAIVTIYDLNPGEADSPFIAMEYVEGPTLHELIVKEGALNPDWVLSVGEMLADGLQAAHAAGIVHRDLKPANILVRSADGVAKISDFGVARVHASDLTEAGATYGSPAYIAPERLRGRPADGRSDLFSLAVILYEALCGKRPFGGDDFATTCSAILHDTPASIRSTSPELVPTFDRFFERALSKDPDLRFQDGAAFRDALAVLRREQEVYGRQLGLAPRPSPASGSSPALEIGTRGILSGLDAAIDEASAAAADPRVDPGEFGAPSTQALPAAKPTALDSLAAWLESPRWPRTAVGVVGLGLLVVLLAIVGGRTAVFRSGGPAVAAPDRVAGSTEAPGLDPLGDGLRRARVRIVESSKGAETAAGAGAPLAPTRAGAKAPAGKAPPAVAPSLPAQKAKPPAVPSVPPTRDASPLPANSAIPGVPPPGSAPAKAAGKAKPAHLDLHIRSSVKAGSLTLLLDGKQVYTTDLSTESRRFTRMVKKTKGQVAQEIEAQIEIPPGQHTLAARMTSRAKPEGHEESIVLLADPGQTRQLRVVAGKGMGSDLELVLD